MQSGHETVFSGTRSPEKSSSVGNASSLGIQAEAVWRRNQWAGLEQAVATNILRTSNSTSARNSASRWGRKVLRSYSSSFYAVTRFLPRDKRADVEMVYAAVRYPDEVVDTFDLTAAEKKAELDRWLRAYELSAEQETITTRVANGIPPTIAGFRDVLVRHQIPDDYYRDFLSAMVRDIEPGPFTDWQDLIDNYIYGSATVVGYFLSYIYGTAEGKTLKESLRGAKSLAIALQLTNFARDVADDAARGRCYLPLDQLDTRGKVVATQIVAEMPEAIAVGKRLLAEEAARWYRRASLDVEAFHPDSRVAISSCLRLYSTLNDRILRSTSPFDRESLSFREKLSVLPRSKYWRLPAALVMER